MSHTVAEVLARQWRCTLERLLLWGVILVPLLLLYSLMSDQPWTSGG